ncbi:hypothetical protein M3P21_02850 [Ruegeria sp. 2012CJ41-6]|uniref:Tetratricopeptide repeat protein n=1 Tax=Ruegeria spongiae TaxID=2942209 RepID=A0ABT0PY44_9RHOB|nr:tetratricopeptide repeat protein [Ruegeria spongiae]MCL6282457.1 hypothetical protein [Ruegeria spongiae]
MSRSPRHLKGTLLSTALTCLISLPAFAQTGSVLSDLENPEFLAKKRAEAAEFIKCDPIDGFDARMAAYEAGATAKWDRASMGCAVQAGSQALDEMSLPTNLIWAFVTFRVDNIEKHLEVLGANLEYFDVLANSYADHYEGIEKSSELYVRWQDTRAQSEAILAKIDPIIPKVTEARILRAAYNLASTVKETPPEEANAAMKSAIEDLEIAIAEKPEALDGLSQLMLGQVLVALPPFLGGDALRGIELLEQANELNPNDLTVHRALVEAYMGEREDEKAIALLQAALEVDPALENGQDYVDDTKHLGGLALRLDQGDMATQFNDKRNERLASNPELLTRKAIASFGHGEENPFTGKDSSDLN